MTGSDDAAQMMPFISLLEGETSVIEIDQPPAGSHAPGGYHTTTSKAFMDSLMVQDYSVCASVENCPICREILKQDDLIYLLPVPCSLHQNLVTTADWEHLPYLQNPAI